MFGHFTRGLGGLAQFVGLFGIALLGPGRRFVERLGRFPRQIVVGHFLFELLAFLLLLIGQGFLRQRREGLHRLLFEGQDFLVADRLGCLVGGDRLSQAVADVVQALAELVQFVLLRQVGGLRELFGFGRTRLGNVGTGFLEFLGGVFDAFDGLVEFVGVEFLRHVFQLGTHLLFERGNGILADRLFGQQIFDRLGAREFETDLFRLFGERFSLRLHRLLAGRVRLGLFAHVGA